MFPFTLWKCVSQVVTKAMDQSPQCYWCLRHCFNSFADSHRRLHAFSLLSWAFSVKTGKFRDRCQHLNYCTVYKRDSDSFLDGSVWSKILFIWSFSWMVPAKLKATMLVKYPSPWAEIKHLCFPPARRPLQHCRLALSLYQSQAKACVRWL